MTKETILNLLPETGNSINDSGFHLYTSEVFSRLTNTRPVLPRVPENEETLIYRIRSKPGGNSDDLRSADVVYVDNVRGRPVLGASFDLIEDDDPIALLDKVSEYVYQIEPDFIYPHEEMIKARIKVTRQSVFTWENNREKTGPRYEMVGYEVDRSLYKPGKNVNAILTPQLKVSSSRFRKSEPDTIGLGMPRGKIAWIEDERNIMIGEDGVVVYSRKGNQLVKSGVVGEKIDKVAIDDKFADEIGFPEIVFIRKNETRNY